MGWLRRTLRSFVKGPLSAAEAADDRDNRAIATLLRRHLRADTAVIDVGCHEGRFLEAVRQHAPRGRHLAFEPLPTFAAQLRQRFPDVTVHELALSDTVGEVLFHHVVTNPGYSGIRQRRLDRSGERVVQVAVRTAILDDLVEAAHPIGLLKIDVEGAELQVLRGAQRTLRRARPFLLFEHGQGGAAAYGTEPEQVFDLLDGLGYTIHGLDEGPAYDRLGFRAEFDGGQHWNFWARPVRPNP